MLRVAKKTIKEVKSEAHLWPSRFRGRRSCCVNRLKNHACRVVRRLFNQWEEG